MAVLCININVPVIHAENITLYISVSSSQVNVGDSITVTVSYSYSGSFAADFQLSWSGPVSYSGGGIGSSGVISVMGNGSNSATFTATGAGTASFSVSGAGMDIVTEADLGVSPQGASVTIIDSSATTEAPSTQAPSGNNNSTTQSNTTESQNDKKEGSDNTLLSKLTISPGTLTPEFSPYTNSYTAQVDEDVTKLTVNASADDGNAVVSVWGANDLEPGENLVQVSVTAENGDVRYYDIHVMVGEEVGTPYTEIDGERYAFVDYEDAIEPLEGFTATTLKYEKWQVLAYKAPNNKLYVCPLVPENPSDNTASKNEEEAEKTENQDYQWYMYLEDKNCFVKYQEYSSRYNRYVILDVPEGVEIPANYSKTSLTINGNKVTAYEPKTSYVNEETGKEVKLYLVYAMNIAGDVGFYNYDIQEDTFMRYNPVQVIVEETTVATPTEPTPTDATPLQITTIPAKDEGFFTKEVLIYFLIGAGALLLIFIIVTVCLGCKNRNLKDDLEQAESMVHQLAGTEIPDKKSKKSKSIMDDVDLFDGDKYATPEMTATEISEAAPEMSAINEAIDAAMVASTQSQQVELIQETVQESTQEMVQKQTNQQGEVAIESVPQVLEIPQIEEVDYAKQSEDINNRIKENYDANMDSAFSDDNN